MGRAVAGLAGCLLVSLLMRTALARFVVEKHSLQVTFPDKIKGEYESALANFGVPQYGGSMEGRVLYPSANAEGCEKFDSAALEFKRPPGDLPHVILLDRGTCFFTKKVFEAQAAGAAAVLVADDKDEALITMDAPDEDPESPTYLANITIPSALIRKSLSDMMKATLKEKDGMVRIVLDWREALPHPDDRVEFEFWTNSNDECGPKCTMQADFVRSFKGVAQVLEKGGYTQFTPHYITWYCPLTYVDTQQCLSQCINKGRYCAPDPEKDFEVGYDGKDVVMENLRQLCVYKVMNESGTPWVWWDYVTDFEVRCPMKEKKYNKECAETVMTSLQIDTRRVADCVGDPTADVDHPILKAEQDAQVGAGDRGDVTILPTLVINQRQYRGKLDQGSVTKALCSGFSEGTEPPEVCLGQDLETNECLVNNGGCWQGYNRTACQDTFRGRICVCPTDPANGVVFTGDGYTDCKPTTGVGRCAVANGGCWAQNINGELFSACSPASNDCVCPPGFKGDGKTCTDINECSENNVCKCSSCKCTNTPGSYDCSCGSGMVYVKSADQCISSSQHKGGDMVFIFSIIGAVLVVAAIAGYVVYKYRLRSYMDSEIRAIMAQYMPLDSQGQTSEGQRLVEP